MSEYHYAELVTPRKWRAGYSGTGDNKQEFFFDCGKCRKKEPVIHGIYTKGNGFYDIALLKADGAFVAPAMFCEECFNALAGPPAVREQDRIGEPQKITGAVELVT